MIYSTRGERTTSVTLGPLGLSSTLLPEQATSAVRESNTRKLQSVFITVWQRESNRLKGDDRISQSGELFEVLVQVSERDHWRDWSSESEIDRWAPENVTWITPCLSTHGNKSRQTDVGRRRRTVTCLSDWKTHRDLYATLTKWVPSISGKVFFGGTWSASHSPSSFLIITATISFQILPRQTKPGERPLTPK